jgi:hypothetical protein
VQTTAPCPVEPQHVVRDKNGIEKIAIQFQIPAAPGRATETPSKPSITRKNRANWESTRRMEARHAGVAGTNWKDTKRALASVHLGENRGGANDELQQKITGEISTNNPGGRVPLTRSSLLIGARDYESPIPIARPANMADRGPKSRCCHSWLQRSGSWRIPVYTFLTRVKSWFICFQFVPQIQQVEESIQYLAPSPSNT